jgi:hypothetical protein
LDLLGINEKQYYSDLASQLKKLQEQWKTINLSIRYAFLFEAWLDLLKWKINEEEFVLIWDCDSLIKLMDQGKQKIKKTVSKLQNWESLKEDVILLDELGWNLFLSESEKKEIMKNINKEEKVLILVK